MYFNQPVFRCFQCEIADNPDKSFTCSGNYIQQGEPNEIVLETKDELEFSFFGRIFDESIFFSEYDIRILCRLARNELTDLELAAIQAETSFLLTDYSLIRKRICELLLASRILIMRSEQEFEEIKIYLNPSIKNILQDIKRLKDLPDYIIFNKHTENITQHASYNYLHLVLDIHWLSLNLDPYLEPDYSFKLDIFEKNLNTIFADLINVSVRKLERVKNSSNLFKISPFLCSCFKEYLLLVQLLIEKLSAQKLCGDFWHYFNKALKNELNLQNCTDGNNAVICIWLTYHTARLQGYDSNGSYIGPQHFRVISNYPLVEQCLKIATNINLFQIDEPSMCSCLHLIASLQINWWKKDASFELLQLLWEYFYKKLNYSNEPELMLINLQKSYDYSSLTNTILEHDLEQLVSENSYSIFLSLLGKYLVMSPAHWPKLKGRIYSKLSPPKLAELTNTGLHNLIQLFFILAYTINFEELTDKLQKLLNQLPASKTESNNVIWSAYISLLIMKTIRNDNLNDLSSLELKTFLTAVQNASSDRSQAHLMKIYIEGLQKIINIDQALRCQEFVLFDGWISRYLQWCSHSDACYLLEIFKNLVERINNLGGNSDWWMVIEKNVVPSIIQLSGNMEAPFEIADLAAILISTNSNRFKNVLEHFAGDAININLSIKFLTTFLEKEYSNLEPDLQKLLIQSWVRISVLSIEKTVLIRLTKQISGLPSWSTVCSAPFNKNEDPLYGVIRTAGIRMRDCKSVQETAALKRWFETYFGRMDRWAGPVISGAEKGENAHEVLRVYTAAAVLCLHCAPALYVKNKSTCILYRLISTLLLPAPVLLNKRPPYLILSALKRTWHLFVRGIARLDYKSDTYVERTLKDICVRYIPHMYDCSSPIIRCLDTEFEDNACSFILDKIANIVSCRSKITHEHTLPALKLILEMSQKKCESINKTEIFLRTILPSLFEQLMFSEDVTAKNIAIDILKKIKNNQFYGQLRGIILGSIMSIIDKQLAFHSINLFRLMEQLVSILMNDVSEILPNLMEAIKKVECMRGVGYDNTLRKGLETVKVLINKQK